MNTNHNISERIFQKIEKEHLQLIPRWHFLFERGFFWLLFILSVLVGAIATSVGIYVFLDHDPSYLFPIVQSPMEDILQSIPYIWISVLLVFSTVAYFGLRKTKKGYRYATIGIVLGTLFMSFILGIALNTVDFGENLHRYLLEHTSTYNKLIHSDEDDWSQADKGLLGGKIVSISSQTTFILKDFEGNIWQVISEAPIKFVVDDYVKVKGTLLDSKHFKAIFIKLWD